MTELMNKVMLSCKKATELIEKKAELKLNNRKKIQLLVHLKFCSGCSNYQKQSLVLDEAIKYELTLSPSEGTIPERKLSPVIKKELLKKLEKY